MTVPPPSAARDRLDPLWIGLIAAALLGGLTPWTGIWEPWEAERAQVVEQLRAGGWLQLGREGRAIAELPFGWWPVALSTALFGHNELGLRLPGVLLAVATTALTLSVTRPLFGRLAAWLAGLGLLTMPLFALHGRLLLGGGIGIGLLALTGLAFVGLATRAAPGAAWRWGAWLGLAACGLAEGAWGLGVAGLTAAVAAVARQRRDGAGAWRQVIPTAAVGVALALVALGWWRAAAHRGEGVSLAALLLWPDGLSAADPAKRPAFHLFVHQLGFGLFPLGALFPLALADLLWRPRAADEPALAAPAAWVLAAWFSAGFLVPALTQPFGQWGWFLAAPAVAVAVGAYLSRALREPPQPLLALVAVITLALLDSNLKHEPRALADMLVGGAVDAFPAKLSGWSVARILNMGLLGVLILFQGGLIRALRPLVRWVAYPTAPIRLFSFQPSRTWLSLALGLATALAVLIRKPDWLERLTTQRFWGRMLPNARLFLIALALLVGAHLLVWGLWNLRRRRLAGDDSGLLDRGLQRVLGWVDTPLGRTGLILAVIGGWGLFLNGVTARVLTQNFSQRDLLSAYDTHAGADEPLVTYRLDARNSSFYTQALERLDRNGFTARAKEAARFFAIVPRKQLASINGEFRQATGRTLPVLDDRSERFLLVSNQLREGEPDRNPITRALVQTLPPGTQATDVVFEDQIQLVGWRLDPPQPRPGSPVTIHLYWKALKKVSGDWKIFVHIDAPGQRIHGDHDPVEGLYQTSAWAVGDLIHDAHRVVVKRTVAGNWYTFYLGLYRGNTRMKITKGDKDNENRAKVGKVKVR